VTNPYGILARLPIAERISAVAADVASGEDIFRREDTHGLAELLGIGDADIPGGDWSFMNVVEPVDLNQVARDSDEIESRWILQLETSVSPARLAELVTAAEQATNSDFDVNLSHKPRWTSVS
jgi:hypothetical protein